MKNTRNKMRKRNKQKMNATSEQHRWCWERTKRKHRLEFAETQAELLKTVQKEMRRVITSERKENEIQHNDRWGTTTTMKKKTLYSFLLQYPSRCVGVCGCVCEEKSLRNAVMLLQLVFLFGVCTPMGYGTWNGWIHKIHTLWNSARQDNWGTGGQGE